MSYRNTRAVQDSIADIVGVGVGVGGCYGTNEASLFAGVKARCVATAFLICGQLSAPLTSRVCETLVFVSRREIFEVLLSLLAVQICGVFILIDWLNSLPYFCCHLLRITGPTSFRNDGSGRSGRLSVLVWGLAWGAAVNGLDVITC